MTRGSITGITAEKKASLKFNCTQMLAIII